MHVDKIYSISVMQVQNEKRVIKGGYGFNYGQHVKFRNIIDPQAV